MYRSFVIGSGSSEEIVCLWKKWKRGLEFYIDAVGINKEKEKKHLRSMVLYLLGEECLDIYITRIDEGDNYNSVLKTLDEYFIPPCNISYERHILGPVSKTKGSPWILVTRLRVLAETCDLGDTINDRIRDQVVQGCFSHDLKRFFF